MDYPLPQNSTHHNFTPASPSCSNSSCFFCIISETLPSLRRTKISHYFKQMTLINDQEQVLALTALFKIAITKPNDPEFPSLGIFKCMTKLIQKSLTHKDWLFTSQNIYTPYYAAHIIGSYTMNKSKFAQKAVNSNVVQPLIELLRRENKISWVEQRVALRALGHLASHKATFEAVAEHEQELMEEAMNISSTCLKEVYEKFIFLEEEERLEYQKNLLTRGKGGLELQNKKAEEWASQIQSWCLYLLNCFARKGRSIGLICKKEFLKGLCAMWGGIELLKTLCETRIGRESVADLEEVILSLCNVSRSSDEGQCLAIESLVKLLRDPVTRYKVIDIVAPVLADLVELRNVGGKQKVGQVITQTLLQDYHKIKFCALNLKGERTKRTLKELWDLKVDRVKRESLMTEHEIKEKEMVASILKQEGNQEFWSGEIEKAMMKYTEALDLCPLKSRKDRIVLHSNRAQCYLLLREPEAAISDTTRALCLSRASCLHSKSLWRRSQAYDMKGLAKESLMDCLMFIKNRYGTRKTKGFKIPCYVARMVDKQLNATWLFASVKSSWDSTREESKEFVVGNKIGALNSRKKTSRTTKDST